MKYAITKRDEDGIIASFDLTDSDVELILDGLELARQYTANKDESIDAIQSVFFA